MSIKIIKALMQPSFLTKSCVINRSVEHVLKKKEQFYESWGNKNEIILTLETLYCQRFL